MSTRRSARLVVVLGLLLATATLLVVALSGHGTTPTRAQQAQEIASTLRCPVCKDLSAADSPAPLAQQMRVQIRRQLEGGDTPEQIRARFVTSYGPSVLVSPPNTGWGRMVLMAPWAVLAVGILLGGWLVRRAVRSGSDRLGVDGAAPPAGPLDENPRALLRQIHDLEDDQAAGRVVDADYQRLHDLLEEQAAAASRSNAQTATLVHRPKNGAGTGTGAATASSPRRRVVRWVAGVAVGASATVGVITLLVSTTSPRAPGTVATGDAPAAAVSGATAAPTPTDGPTVDPLTPEAIATVEAAVDEVKRNPRKGSAHVNLARAYTQAGQVQLATVEYLAATQLDPENPEANTALALVAFQAGSVKQAEALTTKALHGHPGYPEALYTRGLIRAMGLHQAAAATADLKAYQEAAPLGSHARTVATVLALLSSGAIQ